MRIAAILLLTLFSSLLWSQNLVENGSLENTGECPIFSTDIEDIAEPWTNYFGTPDYFHMSCGFPGNAGTTNNSLPFDGDGFVGIEVYGSNGASFQREYLHGQLSSPLEEGKFYRVTFYVKPIVNEANNISLGINNIGMLLTDTVVDTIPNERLLDYQPQVAVEDPIVTTSYWTAICGIIKAKGGEEFITIGNFSADLETNAVPIDGASGDRAYYLIDYVEVVENDLPQLPEDTIICIDQRIDLTINEPDVTVEWNTGFTGKNFIITEPGIYAVTITTPGCSYVDSILVEPANCDECKMYIPNAFTPFNGDNINDRFIVQASCAEDIVNYRIRIFDRWGRKVFESDDLEVAWDGEGAEQMGVYTYTIEYTYPLHRKTQTLTKRGTLTLIE